VRIVLDANVLVAAFAAHGLCEALFEVCLDTHKILMSDELLKEVKNNLCSKINLPAETVNSIVKLLNENTLHYRPSEVAAGCCRDPDDLHVLGLAEAGAADCIVTGDKDLLALKVFKSCPILTPREFSDWIHSE